MTRTIRKGRVTAAIALTALLASVTTPVLSAAAAGPAPAPLLVGSETLAGGAGAAGSMDLTGLGTLGWVHADGSGTETKASASDPLELTNLHPETPLATLTDSPIAFSWSDGAGTASAEGVTTGAVYRYDLST